MDRSTARTILVVEDEPLTRSALRQLVEQVGYDAALAGTGREAIEWLAAHGAPALILLDLVMPEMSGQEVLVQLARRAEWADIPVIVISGNRMELESPQVCAFIQKPFLPDDVRRALRAFQDACR